MATSSQSCGLCNLRHVAKPSRVWCTECHKGLCTECKENHSMSKVYRSHIVMPIAEYRKLPADIMKITAFCSKHNIKYQLYCQKHECPCCSKCIVENHKKCRDFVELDDVIHNVKTSNAMSEIEETLVEVAENLQKIRQYQENNLSTFQQKRKEIEKEIIKTRTKINNHLDKIQEDLIKKLYAVEEQENSKICQLLSSLKKKEKEIEDCQRNIIICKQHATDLQIFLSMKRIEKEVYNKDTFLQSLIEDEKQHSISLKINISIKNIMSDIIRFGEVQIESKPFDIVPTKKKAKQAQMIAPTVQTRSIESIALTIHKTINTDGTYIRGCCMMPDSRMVFTYCYEQTVNIFSKEGSKEFEVKLPCIAYDIAYISGDNSLAVTSGLSDKQLITIIDPMRKQVKKTIRLYSYNFGIASKDNRLIYCAYLDGIHMLNLYDESESTIDREKTLHEGYIAIFKDNIYLANNNTNIVICYSLEGKLQWTFRTESVLESIGGVAVDNDGNVYVVGTASNNVVVISPNGQRHKEILSKDDGLCAPTSLHYCGRTNQLLVANLNNEAHLFNVI